MLRSALSTLTALALALVATTANATTLNEGFEANQTGSYTATSVVGDACTWNLSNAGVYTDATNSHQGTRSLRLGTSATSSATMAADKSGGAAAVSFYGRTWSAGDGTATIQVQYSADNGSTWTTAGTASLSTTTYTKNTYTINKAGNIRIRFQQTAGKRALIDDVSITDYAEAASASFSSPTNGSTVDFGKCTANTTAQQSITVKGSGFTSATTVAVSGTGFSANTSSLSAAKVNSMSGATVQVNFNGANGGTYTGTLTLTNGSTVVKVTLKATVSGTSTATDAVFTSPASGSMVDFGSVAANTTAQQSVVVKGSGFTSATTVSVSGTGFTAGATSLSAAKVNSTSGATVQLYFKGANGGSYTGTLKLTNGSSTTKVTLKATVSGSTGTTTASYSSPASGSTIDFGSVTLSKTQTSTVVVKGANLTAATTVTVTGTGFSAGASTLSAAKVNSDSGAQLQINFKSASAGTFNGTLKLTSGTLTRTVSLTAKAVADTGSTDPGTSSGGSSSGGSTSGGTTSGNIPSGYYSTCENKYGATLLTALCSKISSHTAVSYSGLWSAFKDTDTKDNGKIWDMYSTKEFTYSTNQCGTYSKIGDCYNREHSFPKSWFNDATPMYTDLFHVYPTDGYVNNQRSNYPFGECSGGTYVASSGNTKPLGKLGKSTVSGYTGTVWEPDDEYKGDFARTYFYMVAAYNDKIPNWSSEMLDGSKYPGFASWAVTMLLNWNSLDPVSQKEIDRNEAVYAKQKNRNPFIDHPELADYIWGSKKTTGWNEGASTAAATFSYPADGSTISFGTTATGSTNEKIVKIKGTGLGSDITASVEGDGFESAEVIKGASAADSQALATSSEGTAGDGDDTDTGIRVRIMFNPTAAASYNGRLTLTDGTAVSNVTLTSETLDGLPAAPAEKVTDNSFVARWVEVGDAFSDGTYRLDVADKNGPVEGFPVYVDADALTYEVSGLDADTEYTYSLTSQTTQSNIVSVTTLEPQPSVFFVYDPEEMSLTTKAMIPSDVVEILFEGENLAEDITFTVSAPFEVSIDGIEWNSTVTAPQTAESVFVRLGAAASGDYVTSLKTTSGSYFNDAITIQGTAIADAVVEDFEKYQTNAGSYDDKSYEGSAATWNLHDAGIWNTDTPYEGKYCLRFGKTAGSSIELASHNQGGLSQVSFYARKWSSSEKDATVEVQYSTGDDDTWATMGTFNVTSVDYTCFTAEKTISDPVKIRIIQTAGARMLLDYIELKAQSVSAVSDIRQPGAKVTPVPGGVQVVTDKEAPVSIYCIDGTILANAVSVQGSRTFTIPAAGIYIVAVGDTARRLVLR